MRELPTGTGTLLFTDIDGSTRLLAALGDAYGAELAEHRRRLRVACSRHGGVEVDSQGDSCFFAFPRARDALIAALEGLDALEATPIRVRMGIHTGEPRPSDDGYVGMDVHLAARLMAAGHGGQVLVSEATRAVVGDAFELQDLGLHRLKDVDDPMHPFDAVRAVIGTPVLATTGRPRRHSEQPGAVAVPVAAEGQR